MIPSSNKHLETKRLQSFEKAYKKSQHVGDSIIASTAQATFDYDTQVGNKNTRHFIFTIMEVDFR